MSAIENHLAAEGGSLSPRADRMARFRQIDPHGDSGSIVTIGFVVMVGEVLMKLLEDGDAQ